MGLLHLAKMKIRLQNLPQNNAAEDMSRPVCKCHGFPMRKHGFRQNGKQTWSCSLKRRGIVQKYRDTAVAMGLCPSCCIRKRPLGQSKCNYCATYQVNKTIDKYTYLLSLDRNDPEYIAIVQGGSVNG